MSDMSCALCVDVVCGRLNGIDIHIYVDMDPRVHAQPANEIIPRLWLGNAHAAADETFFRTHQINVVINCTKDIPFSGHAPKQYRIPVDDNLEEEEIRNMAHWSPQTVYTIMQHYKNGDRILVHCMAGINRSATLVLAYVSQRDTTTTLQKVERFARYFDIVTIQRPIILMNEGFYEQLIDWIHDRPVRTRTNPTFFTISNIL